MIVLETERLILYQFSLEDAPFVLTLLNGPIASYKQNGFGLYLVELKDSRTPIGMCGLIKRAELPDVDIGFAFLPDFWNQGFAFEAATAVLKHGHEMFKLARIVAITSLDNNPSIKL